jgi:hypothetical protein
MKSRSSVHASPTEARLTEACELVAGVGGQLALAIARRRVVPAAEAEWAARLRRAADMLAPPRSGDDHE